MIKVLSTKIESKGKVDEMNENLESKDTLKKELSSKLKQFRLVKPNSKFIRINNQNNIRSLDKRENKVKSESNNIKQNFNEEIKIKNFGKTSVGFRNNLKDDDINENQDLVFLRKELIKKIKESEDYRSKFEYYKTKLDLINKKYGNIMQLFEGVLVNIYEDKNMKYIKNIFINLEDFKQCNFETLSSEQKYSIVLLIIKYLMPLINPHNLPYKFKSLFSNVDDVTFINEKTEKGNNLLSSTSYVSSNYKEKSNRHIAVKSRIKSSSSDFGKTQLFFDNKYHKQLNNLYSSTNVLNSNENTLTRNKKPKNKDFLKFLSRESSEKSLGTYGFGYKYGALLKNFFTSLEADSFNNNKLEKGYSLFNV
jgi:hypothetical protein